ncbi:flagellar export chaperone FliS [Jatrophihabitans telluris]|uniref:Flagellar export chaperone FliS n=1 Tax=Jatrophihabitans telluris TaxID=2038343 RepID=A0ABY4QYM2_9ACTN|nr:flagellar export chaperone FliS [Jatrophihabitans telluris]UQX87946.1 flagellar export chaperone FliS [Jatrophihabitans telluris]
MTASPAQLRYLADAVSTASPAQRVVMLYDRLVLDLRRAGEAHALGDIFAGSEQLRHAQLIVAELRASLRLDDWDGAENLAGLYGFMLAELMAVNVNPDAERLNKVIDITAGLRDAWRTAGAEVINASAAAASAASAATASRGPGSTDAPPRPAAWVG